MQNDKKSEDNFKEEEKNENLEEHKEEKSDDNIEEI